MRTLFKNFSKFKSFIDHWLLFAGLNLRPQNLIFHPMRYALCLARGMPPVMALLCKIPPGRFAFVLDAIFFICRHHAKNAMVECLNNFNMLNICSLKSEHCEAKFALFDTKFFNSLRKSAQFSSFFVLQPSVFFFYLSRLKDPLLKLHDLKAQRKTTAMLKERFA